MICLEEFRETERTHLKYKFSRFNLPPSPPEDSLALAPYLDLLNHHPNAVVDAGVNLDPVAPPGFQIVTRKAIKKGDQVGHQG